jgi:hypothetical protein
MVAITPRTDADCLRFTVCLAPGTKAGTYPREVEYGELIDRATAAAVEPMLVSGTLTVLEDLQDGLGCPSTGVRPPAPIEATFELGDAAGSPGSEVSVPFRVEASTVVAGFLLSVDFDEEVLEATGIAPAFVRPDGKGWDFQAFDVNNLNDVPGSAGVDEGYVTAKALFSFERYDYTIPAGTRADALALGFRIRPDAAAGSATEVRFLDGGLGRGEPVANTLFAVGQLSAEFVPPEMREAFVFVNGVLRIVPDVALFIRGDSNRDEVLDLSDATSTLGFLFRGTSRVDCLDAADANDDGKTDISDAIATLQYLFLGGAALPPPIVAPGADPTDDALGICI